MPVTRDMLVAELQSLLRLTAFEQTIATVRRSQARTPEMEGELAANAKKSSERMQLLSDAVRRVGGVPDVVGPVLGKAGALLTTQFNQVQSLQGALLGDLTLEHQLRERTRFARSMARSLGQDDVLPVLDRLETAHTATIEWLETRIAEVGRTGTSALRATPVQAAVMIARRAALAPWGVAASGVNRASDLLQKLGQKAPEVAAEAATEAAAEVKEVVDGARDRVVDLTGSAAEQGNELREGAAAPRPAADGEHPPFAGYDKVSGDSVMRHVADTEDVEELRVLLAYERANKARKGVLQAAEARLSELAVGV